jgi:tetratricopeptide (TPR) repeat protein
MAGRSFSGLLLVVVCLLAGVSGHGQAQTDVTCGDIAPPDVPAPYYIGLGDAYFSQGNYTLAVVAYTCAVDLDPNYAPAFINRGFAYAIQLADPQAMADYNRALEIDESLVAAYNNRGMLYLSQGNFGLALNDFDLAVALDPGYAIAYNNRGLVHAAEGHYDLAIADFQQAITFDPAYAVPHASLGAVYSALALQSYQSYLSIAGPGTRLPAGQPDDIMNALDGGLKNSDFTVWLAFLTPAR